MSIQELMAQRAEIDRQIAESKANQLADCVLRALAVFTTAGFTQSEAADVLIARFNRNLRKAKKPARNVVAPKYRSTETDATWSGRGVKPHWFTAGHYEAI